MLLSDVSQNSGNGYAIPEVCYSEGYWSAWGGRARWIFSGRVVLTGTEFGKAKPVNSRPKGTERESRITRVKNPKTAQASISSATWVSQPWTTGLGLGFRATAFRHEHKGPIQGFITRHFTFRDMAPQNTCSVFVSYLWPVNKFSISRIWQLINDRLTIQLVPIRLSCPW